MNADLYVWLVWGVMVFSVLIFVPAYLLRKMNHAEKLVKESQGEPTPATNLEDDFTHIEKNDSPHIL